ncbi:MAG: radical SAM family heme chaperone HemW [Vicinamibacterales bacterium]
MSPEDAWHPRTIGLYLHIPFCVQRCDFCGYKVRAGADRQEEMAAFVKTLKQEICSVRQLAHAGPVELSVLFIGGGTPSMLPIELMEELLECVTSQFRLAADCEFTVECNPSSTAREKLRRLHTMGVNRLSIGVQSFDDRILAAIGRDHSSAEARATVLDVRQEGFSNVSLDLMYRLPAQTREDLVQSVRSAVACGPTHVSLYPLWVRPGTRLHHRLQHDNLRVPDEGSELDMWRAAAECLAGAGYRQYNVFDFTLNDGSRSRYTFLQWEDGEWIGAGPSAISYLAGRHLTNAVSVREWSDRVSRFGVGTTGGARVSRKAQMHRTMIFGLRMIPFETARFEAQYGIPVDCVFGRELELLEGLRLIERSAQQIRLTAAGVQRINNIGKFFYEQPEARQTLGIARTGLPLEESDL